MLNYLVCHPALLLFILKVINGRDNRLKKGQRIMKSNIHYNRRNRKYFIWIFPIGIAVMIFCFSAQPGDDSAQLSNRFVEVFLQIRTGLRLFPRMSEAEVVALFSILVRKSAHVTEYLLLCIALNTSFCVSGIKNGIRILFSFLLTFGYACTDEVHQLFVPGRAGLFTDVLIDSSGAFVLSLILLCYSCVRKKKLHKDIL